MNKIFDFIFLFFILCYVAWSCADNNNFQEYILFDKGDSTRFGYDSNHVCYFMKYSGGYYVGLENPYTFEKPCLTPLDYVSLNSTIKACFLYMNYSYVLFRNNTGTFFVKGRNIQPTNNDYTKFDIYFYDHIIHNLYALDDQTLYKINFISNSQHIVANISCKVSDIIIVNNTIYYISTGPGSFNTLYKQNFGDLLAKRIELVTYKKFSFIPFFSNKTLTHQLELFPTPFNPFWIIMLYFVDFVFIVISIIIVKYPNILLKFFNVNVPIPFTSPYSNEVLSRLPCESI